MAINAIDWFLDGPITDSDVTKKWQSLKSSAGSRGKEFTLSLKKVRKLLEAKRCAYSGVSLTPEQNKPNSKTIDRVDNNLGYTDDNVVACAYRINQIKGDTTVAELKAMYKGVTRHLDKKVKAQRLLKAKQRKTLLKIA